MTLEFTNPLDALQDLKFSDNSRSPIVHGRIHQNQDHTVSIEIFFEDRLQPTQRDWPVLDRETLECLVEILDHRIDTTVLEKNLRGAGFSFSDIQA